MFVFLANRSFALKSFLAIANPTTWDLTWFAFVFSLLWLLISRSNWHLFCQVLSLFTKGFQCTNISPWFPESKQLFLINVPLNFRIPGDLFASHWIGMENYCHTPFSLKHTDTCKWSGRVFWSCSRRTFLYVFTKSIQFPNVISISLLLATYQYVLTVTGATCTHCRPIFNSNLTRVGFFC